MVGLLLVLYLLVADRVREFAAAQQAFTLVGSVSGNSFEDAMNSSNDSLGE